MKPTELLHPEERKPSKRRKRSIKEIEGLLAKIKEYLRKVYGERLEAIILYGSFPRNKATEDSDIDIALILKGDIDPLKEIDRVGDFISDIGLEHNELITIFPISSQEVKNSIWPLYKSLQKEGIRLWTR